MLLRFRFSNTRSFRNEQELSFVATPLKDKPEIVVKVDAIQDGVLPLIGIYGANASGKTNVIRALSFMDNAVENSYRNWRPDGGIPRREFGLSTSMAEQPSLFAIDFVLRGVRHEYGFVADSKIIHEEWLYVYPNNKRQSWFVRKQGKPITFSSRMQGENRAIESLTRSNSLFLSTAAQNNHEALTAVYQWFSNQLDYIEADRMALASRTAQLCAEDDFRAIVSEIVKEADLGLMGINVTQETMPDELKTAFKAFFSALKSRIASDETLDLSESVRSTIEFLHRTEGAPVSFAPAQESHGTAAFLSLLGPIIETLRNGKVLAIDELDAHLHPLLAIRLIQLFNNQDYNRNGAQLLFTTHDTNLLRVLRRDQIWFTEKGNDGSSILYPLTDFKPRRGENLENGYLQGRYGAIPFIDADRFLGALEHQHAEPL